ncbi:MAG: beta-galactosidase trimerization domain-containing protein [Propionibacteriaceae bacterium]
MNPSFFPRRTIHLDFHTGPDVPDVGADFDPAAFAATFADAHVDSVTVFAKCHHGLLYYGTDRAERHPGLASGLDLLKQQVDALHAVGIHAPVYLSVQVDEHAAMLHPEWVALEEDLRLVRWGAVARTPGSAFVPGWFILDMSSPYQDYLADQVRDVLDHLGQVDGLFLDMCWDQPSSSRYAITGALAEGLDPSTVEGRAAYARIAALRYMRRFQDLAAPYLAPDVASGVWFNSRPKTNLHEEAKLLRHVEVESLPTGGWGYAYLPYVARFVRPLGLPTLSHTGRFHQSWGDNASLKPAAALAYECRQILSLGLTNGVGDLLHPRGVPNAAVYDRIGRVYAYIEACEPFLDGTRPVAEVALVVDPELGDAPGAAGIGAVRMLQQLRYQFDVVPPGTDLTPYALVLVPETTVVDPALRAALSAYVERGGAVVLVGDALLGSDGEVSLPAAGIVVHGRSPFAHTFLRTLSAELPDPGQDTVVYDRGLQVRALDGTEVLIGTVEPYFDRTWEHFSGHSYTAPDALSEWAAVTRRGRVASVAAPLLQSYGRLGNEVHRQVMASVLAAFLPRPAVRVDGPLHLETTVWRGPDRTVVHLLSYLPTRVGSGLGGDIDLVDDPFPLVELAVEIAVEQHPRRAMLQPAGKELPLRWSDGIARTTVTVLDGHALIVIDHATD